MRMSLTALCVVALFSLGHAYEVVEPQMTMRPGAILAGRFGPVAEFSDGTSGFTKPATYRKTAVQLVDGLWETLVGIDATNGIAINDMVALDNGTYFIAFNGYVLESCGFIARYDPGVGLTCLETGLNSAPTSLVVRGFWECGADFKIILLTLFLLFRFFFSTSPFVISCGSRAL